MVLDPALPHTAQTRSAVVTVRKLGQNNNVQLMLRQMHIDRK